jgi:hypothetical protein
MMDTDRIDLNFFSTWVQIQKLPVGYRNDTLIRNLMEKKVGRVEETQTNVQGAGNFVRVKVRLDVRKCLERWVSMSRSGQREIFMLKYEKMPRFGGACGLIGHSHLECGNGEHVEADLKWGEWLKADWETWHGRGMAGARGRGRGTRGGRAPDTFDGGRVNTGARTGHMTGSWRHNAIPYVNGTALLDPSLRDTATSPVKDRDMEIDHDGNGIAGAKRNLIDDFSEEDGTMDNTAGGNLATTETLPPPIGAETDEVDARKNK